MTHPIETTEITRRYDAGDSMAQIKRDLGSPLEVGSRTYQQMPEGVQRMQAALEFIAWWCLISVVGTTLLCWLICRAKRNEH